MLCDHACVSHKTQTPAQPSLGSRGNERPGDGPRLADQCFLWLRAKIKHSLYRKLMDSWSSFDKKMESLILMLSLSWLELATNLKPSWNFTVPGEDQNFEILLVESAY